MLQVITGKFFRPVELYETPHRGVLFTNYWSFEDGPIDLPIGRILPSTSSAAVRTFTYELVEKLESVSADGNMEAMISTGGSELASDLAVVLSFALDITCTTEPDLIRRLTGQQTGMRAVRETPSQLIPRLFDERVASAEGDAETLKRFMAKLLGLDRRTYEAAIRAMRQFVFAGHRIIDDLDLAYVLYVMSMESLAQSQDGSHATWPDYDAAKARRIDEALAGAPDVVVEAVRQAVLANEHVAISRRFRDFVRDHVEPSFFRDQARGRQHPPSRRSLSEAIRNAYGLRSAYVHRLERAPRELWALGGASDTTQLETGCYLTLAGVSRLARHVIWQMVERGASIDKENGYDYRAHLPNIIRARLAPSMWLGNPQTFDTVSAKRHLEACLEQFTSVLMNGSKEPVSNLKPILKLVEARVGSAQLADRLCWLTLYGVWNSVMSPEHRMENWERLLKTYEKELDAPTPATLASHVLLGLCPGWTVDQWAQARDAHASAKGGNRLETPRILDAAIDLAVAEQLRAAGDEEGARALIVAAVEAFPGCEALIGFEQEALDQSPLEPIDWNTLLRTPQPSADGAD